MGRRLVVVALCVALAVVAAQEYDGPAFEEDAQSLASDDAPAPEQRDGEEADQQWQAAAEESDDYAMESQAYQQRAAAEQQQTQQSDQLTQETQQSEQLTQETQQSEQQTQDTQVRQQSDEGTNGRIQSESQGRWPTQGSNPTGQPQGQWPNTDPQNPTGQPQGQWPNTDPQNPSRNDFGLDRPGGVAPLSPRPQPPRDYTSAPTPNPTGHYKVHETPRTWPEALMTCVSEGAELAIASNAREAKAIGDLYKKVKDRVKKSEDKNLFFVGASDLAKENTFITLSGKELGPNKHYVNWQKGEPNNHKKNEHCVLSNEVGLYWDGNCLAKYAFVCRFKDDPCRPPITPWPYQNSQQQTPNNQQSSNFQQQDQRFQQQNQQQSQNFQGQSRF